MVVINYHIISLQDGLGGFCANSHSQEDTDCRTGYCETEFNRGTRAPVIHSCSYGQYSHAETNIILSRHALDDPEKNNEYVLMDPTKKIWCHWPAFG